MLADTDKILPALAPLFLTSRASAFLFHLFSGEGKKGWEMARPRDRGATGAGHVGLGASLRVGPGEVRAVASELGLVGWVGWTL